MPMEALVVWAYGEVCKQPDNTGNLDSVEQLAFLGTRVDESERETKLPIGAGEPHIDAPMVELKIRKLTPLRLDWKQWRDILAPDVGACVQENDPRLRRICVDRYTLVRTHGIQGPNMKPHPHWDMRKPEAKRIIAGNGKTIVEGRTISAGQYSEGSYCPLSYDPSPMNIIEARFDYFAWWTALVELSQERWNLVDHEPLPPLSPPAPWITGAPKKPRILPTITPPTNSFVARAHVNV